MKPLWLYKVEWWFFRPYFEWRLFQPVKYIPIREELKGTGISEDSILTGYEEALTQKMKAIPNGKPYMTWQCAGRDWFWRVYKDPTDGVWKHK